MSYFVKYYEAQHKYPSAPQAEGNFWGRRLLSAGLHLSDEQRELSELSFEKRAEWMAEWLLLASQTDDDEDE